MRAEEFVTEAQVPPVRDQIIRDVQRSGGAASDYFVRFTSVDRVGFSDRQHFKRHRDVDDPKFSVTGIGGQEGGRRALWFYPLAEYLKQSAQGQYAMDMPYVWLVRLKPNAWLQPVGHTDERVVKAAPDGKQRVGLLKGGLLPQAVFFAPAFDVIGRYYNYPAMHQRHGEVQGRPAPTFFDRVRGDA
jgi:hypothetical protein